MSTQKGFRWQQLLLPVNRPIQTLDTLGAASTTCTEVVIEQDGKPTATLISHTVFEAMKCQLLRLHGLQKAEKNRRERLVDPSSTVTLTELAAKLNFVAPLETR